MRKEDLKKLYPYRKLRALYGTRLTSKILKGAMDDDETMCETHLDIDNHKIRKTATI